VGSGAPDYSLISNVRNINVDPLAVLSGARLYEPLWIIAGLLIVWGAPNTQDIMNKYRPVIGIIAERRTLLEWAPSLRWAVATALLFGGCLTQIKSAKIFLYWSF
jgi:hypothetical protein